MIFGYIRARKDWFSALIQKNRLEYEEDSAQKEVEAQEAADLKVKKKIYLDNRVRTQENPLFTKWCRGRMDSISSKNERSDELSFFEEEKVDVPLLGKRTSSMEEESKEKFQADWNTDSKMVSSKPSAQMKHDEKFQDGRKMKEKTDSKMVSSKPVSYTHLRAHET